MKTAEEFAEHRYQKLIDDKHSWNIQQFTLWDMVEFAEAYAQQNTLNREKVMEILNELFHHPHAFLTDYATQEELNQIASEDAEMIANYADAICALALPEQNTLNREKVMEMLTKQDENGNYWEILRYDRKRIGVNNLLVPYDGTEELADAICNLITNKT
jgi:hypothetical protein